MTRHAFVHCASTAAAGSCCAGAAAAPASAQVSASADAAGPRPRHRRAVGARTHQGPVGHRPEAKVTEVDGDTAGLVGGYGGILLQGSVLIGGGVYTLPNGPHDSELTYGGLVVGVTLRRRAPRLLRGARTRSASATASSPDSIRFGVPVHPHARRRAELRRAVNRDLVVQKVTFDETFMVAEPQAEVALRLAASWRLAFGVGYRFTNASDYIDDRVNGATGTVAIVFGGGDERPDRPDRPIGSRYKNNGRTGMSRSARLPSVLARCVRGGTCAAPADERRRLTARDAVPIGDSR